MILLTFNIINNRPETTSGQNISEGKLLEISINNTMAILRNLESLGIICTFFIDVPIIEKIPSLIKRIIGNGHEIALYSSGNPVEEIVKIKEFAENLIEKTVRGIRRKTPILSAEEIKNLGFTYISDIENANILYPFKRLERGTKILNLDGISIIPESISPYSQLPYNDFVFQAVPLQFYKNMVTETLKNDEFLIFYLNTWQLTDLKKYHLKVPFYRRYNSGRKLEDKLENFLRWISQEEIATARIKDYIF